MPVPSKPYTFSNGPSNLIDATQVNADFDVLYAALTGALDDTNVASALLDKLGVSSTGGSVRRGKSIVSGAETRNSAVSGSGYGWLATPDRVQNVVLPTDGLIVVAYQALWQESIGGAARAAIFLGSGGQLKVGQPGGVPAVQEAALNGSSATDGLLSSCPVGLVSGPPSGAASLVTTGQAVALGTTGSPMAGSGGVCHIYAAAGTYDVNVQFKSSSGTVTAKSRSLWVYTIGF